MAGGKFAAEVPCMVCMGDGVLTKAARTFEGREDDEYHCDKGHSFSMEWRRGPATEPQWPVDAELAAALKSS